MPELPDIVVYAEKIADKIVGRALIRVRLANPFLVRSFDPKLDETFGKAVLSVGRLGKRLVFALEGDLYLVLHLMISGRLKWLAPGAKIPGKVGSAAFDFEHGSLILTEASSKKRASLHVVRGQVEVEKLHAGGLEVLECDEAAFACSLRHENHTLKRSLTDPRIFSGIGNAYSDEILHAARLSPMLLSQKVSDEQVARLFEACRATLTAWTERLRAEAGDFPGKVTAFRPEMAVHGRYQKPCPVCQQPVQRIVYAANETNYCAHCQTGGKLLSDRALSRLLREDFPRTLEEMELLRRG